jgi:hypothetical protein
MCVMLNVVVVIVHVYLTSEVVISVKYNARIETRYKTASNNFIISINYRTNS